MHRGVAGCSVVILALWGCASSSRTHVEPREAPAVTAQPAPTPDGTPTLSPEATYHYLRARLLLEHGDAEGATAAVREAMVFHHESPLLHALLSEALLRQGRVADALTEAERGLTLDARCVEAHQAKAAALWEAGRYAQAEESLRVVMAQSPQPLEAERLAEILVGRGDVAGAQQVGNQLAARFPDDDEALMLVARVCRKHGDWDCAAAQMDVAQRAAPESVGVCTQRAELTEEQGRLDDAVALRARCAALSPSDEELQLALIRAQARAARTTELRDTLRTLLSRHPDDRNLLARTLDALLDAHAPQEALRLLESTARRPGLQPEIDERHGRALSVLGRCQEAEAVLARIALDSPEGQSAAHVQAACQLRRRAAQEALGTLDAALAVHPRALPLLALRCTAYRMAGLRAQARRVADELRTDQPASEVTAVRAGCLVDAGEPAEAIRVASAPLAERPDDVGALLALAEMQWRAGRKDEAARTARSALAVQPDSAEVQNFLAYCLLTNGGDATEAAGLAERALKRVPSSAAVLDTLGVAQLALGQHTRALRTLQDAARLEPHEAEILLHLGDAWRATGQRAKALRTYAAALALLPMDEEVEGMLRARGTSS
ncbi:MAG: tetratricopeptide repeat protein [Myxococcota bacterium]